MVKAVTYLDQKWGWLNEAAEREGVRLLRVSIGRHGDTEVLQRSDEELVELGRIDLAHFLGIDAQPIDSRVTRWGWCAAAVRGRPPLAPRADQPGTARAAEPRSVRCVLRRRGGCSLRRLRLRGGRSGRPRARRGPGRSSWLIPATPASARVRARRRATSTSRDPRYTMWSVYRLVPGAPSPSGDLAGVVAGADADDVVLRGVYDVAGLRGDADLMVWWHGRDDRGAPGRLPRGLRRTELGCAPGAGVDPRWRCTGRPSSTRATSRPSWPTRSPQNYVCVYPFVRSYEWYLLDERERRDMLVEHGQMARDYPDVRANTVAVVRPRRLRVDARVRGRRAAPDRRPDARTCARSTARRHVREEIPFFTGPRVEVGRPTPCCAADRMWAQPSVVSRRLIELMQ